MTTDEEFVFDPQNVKNDIESVRKKFEGLMYLDPRCDPAFKALLDSEDSLVNFLNGIMHLEGDDAIQSLTYKIQQEENFRLPEPYGVKFDIGAHTKAGKRIDIEMQQLKLKEYIPRMMIYNAFLLLRAKNDYNKEINFYNLPDTEKEKYRYKLPEIYSIWIMDHPVDFMGKGIYHDEVALYNKSNVEKVGCIPISSENKYIMIDLTKFNKKFEELESDEERWLYILKNAGSSRSSIKFGKPAIEDALRRIECGTASEELLIRQANMTDYINVCRAAVAESFDDGFEKGEAKGVADERTAVALDMLADNEPLEKIVKYSHLSMEKVLELKESQAVYNPKK
ncbi:MAG: PD-(D/E)XK nuclease family transposase [Fibrobacter sp.]|nr:PD-(D/E)XK nuclease family transposase [Fibrobacter sp.]